jgi:hypothetical protein
MAIRVSDIMVWRDGGTITFTLDGSQMAGKYRLRTRFGGEPRPLFRDERQLSFGGSDEAAVLANLREWFAASATSHALRALVRLDEMRGWRNLPDDLVRVVPLHRVRDVIECLEARSSDRPPQREQERTRPETFDLGEWSIVPGPLSIRPPFDSSRLDVIEEYAPQVVAAAALAVPGTELIHLAEPDWWSWAARWSARDGHIDLAMTLFDTARRPWGGFKLAGTAGPRSLLEIYRRIHAVLPAAWLHNAESELHTAESFGARMNAL